MSDSNNRKATFLDPERIENALAQIASIANTTGAEVALAGGCALQLYGSPRFTQDVDVIAAKDFGAPTLKTASKLSFGGRSTKAPNGVPVDIIVRADDYAGLYDDALAHAARIPGVPIRVTTLPFLAAMKLAAGRGKDEQDLEFILLDAHASYKQIRAVVRRHLGIYAAGELDAQREIAKWNRKKRR